MLAALLRTQVLVFVQGKERGAQKEGGLVQAKKRGAQKQVCLPGLKHTEMNLSA